jgi:type I restriction enzyme, S subunit
MSEALRAGYKLTEVGVIPEDWEVKQITEVCDFIVPGRNKPQFSNDAIPWITTPDLEDGEAVYESRLGLTVSKADANSIGSKVVPAGSVVMSCVGELGITAYAGRDIVINQQLHAFIPSRHVDGHFLLHVVRTRKSYLESIATKTALPFLNKDNCNSIRLPFPKLPEQRAIATALSDIDALLAKLDTLIAKKRNIKQATMQQLLTGQTRLPGFSGEWEVKRLGEISEIAMGRTPRRLNSAYWGTGYKWLSIADLKAKIISNSKEEITPLAAAEMTIIPKGTLLMSFKLSIGRLAFAGCDLFTNEAICSFNKLHANADFLYYILGRVDFSLYGKQAVKGYTLNKESLKQVEVTLPSMAEQTAIAIVLSDMDTELATLETRRDKTLALKQGMMQELLTGRIRLV